MERLEKHRIIAILILSIIIIICLLTIHLITAFIFMIILCIVDKYYQIRLKLQKYKNEDELVKNVKNLKENN